MTETTRPYDFIEGQKVMVSEDAYFLYNSEAREASKSVRGKECYLTKFPTLGSMYGKYTATVVATFGEPGTAVDAACLSHPTPAYGTPENTVAAEPEVEDEVEEPTEVGAQVSYYDLADEEWYLITRTDIGEWRLDGSRWSETWKFYIEDARPGTVKVVN